MSDEYDANRVIQWGQRYSYDGTSKFGKPRPKKGVTFFAVTHDGDLPPEAEGIRNLGHMQHIFAQPEPGIKLQLFAVDNAHLGACLKDPVDIMSSVRRER